MQGVESSLKEKVLKHMVSIYNHKQKDFACIYEPMYYGHDTIHVDYKGIVTALISVYDLIYDMEFKLFEILFGKQAYHKHLKHCADLSGHDLLEYIEKQIKKVDI